MSDAKTNDNAIKTTQGSVKPDDDAKDRRPEASVQTTQHDQYQEGGHTSRQNKVLKDHVGERAKEGDSTPGLHSQGSHTGIAGGGAKN